MPDIADESNRLTNLLCNKNFQLVDNVGGHVTGATVMRFGDQQEPWLATYAGPNVVAGQVMLDRSAAGVVMLYHARTTEGAMVAGRASVSVIPPATSDAIMAFQLQWQWLYGDEGQGVSHWRQI